MFFKKDEMAKVVPLLRALNAMIIQYRNRFVRVHKSGPQVMTRYCLKSWMTTVFCYFVTPLFKTRGWGNRCQTSEIIDCFKSKKKDAEHWILFSFWVSKLGSIETLLLPEDYFSFIKANILDIQKQMEQSLYISIIFANFMIRMLNI